MAEIVLLDDKRAKLSDGQGRLVSQLEVLLKRARQGELRGLVYATISSDEPNVVMGMSNDDGCGLHELIGISNMLSDRLVQMVREADE